MRVGGVRGGGWDLGLLGINVELGVAIELKRFIQKLHLYRWPTSRLWSLTVVGYQGCMVFDNRRLSRRYEDLQVANA
jgi:hypothetical protein